MELPCNRKVTASKLAPRVSGLDPQEGRLNSSPNNQGRAENRGATATEVGVLHQEGGVFSEGLLLAAARMWAPFPRASPSTAAAGWALLGRAAEAAVTRRSCSPAQAPPHLHHPAGRPAPPLPSEPSSPPTAGAPLGHAQCAPAATQWMTVRTLEAAQAWTSGCPVSTGKI